MPIRRPAQYVATVAPVHTLMKVETHNHPTAISPFPGAATGSGGELRDEGATGRGGRPKAGLTGFTVSNLALPGWEQPWELPGDAIGRPDRIASALQIMLEGPIGAAAFNNEFGRPNITGYFRTLRTGGSARRQPWPAATTSRSCWPAASATSRRPTWRRRIRRRDPSSSSSAVPPC